MKISIKIFTSIFLILFLLSCRNNQTSNEKLEVNEPPKALQEKKLDIQSYGRKSSNLIDELYSDLVENSPELLQLENDLERINLKPEALKDNLNAFDNKSERYYSSAEYKTSQITDSLLMVRIRSIISKSKNKYETNVSDLKNLVASIDKGSKNINDNHLVMKIILTLPIIEKYQKENIPSSKEYKELIIEQSKFVERISKTTQIR